MVTLRTLPRAVWRRIRPTPAMAADTPRLEEYRLPASRKDELAPQYTGALGQVFFGPKDRLVDKWLHYLDIYDRHFERLRNKPLTFFEIGVFKGGSLEMWRQYFGPEAAIWGVDIDPACAGYETPGTKIRIGSQDDPAFLNSVVAEMGPPDIILDDGSHIAAHQEASFRTLFPLLKDGGLYVIEDLHSSYWAGWGGGYRKPGSALELVKVMIDDMHAWYHHHGATTPAQHQVGAIHVYDSIVFIEKAAKQRPGFIRVMGRLSDPADLTDQPPVDRQRDEAR